jgi:hypothetical protein
MSTEQHCPTCHCGRRAPVQRGYRKPRRSAGSISWAEHLEAFAGYAAQYGNSQSAERLAERGGFSYGEVTDFLGHEPTTWLPIPARSAGAQR